MKKRAGISWIFVALLGSSAVLADESRGLSTYPAAFFTDSRPATAYDMVSRLPGFSLDTGNSARGFAGTAGNILVDGARPTAKTDDVSSILQRIPASAVDHIEVIRGGAPGIDMQGQTVVANIVRRADATEQLILTSTTTWLGSGQFNPAFGAEYHGQVGKLRYEASLARTNQVWNDGAGTGYRVVTAPGGTPVYDRARSWGVMRPGYSAHAGVIAPLFGGEWNNNVTLQTNDFASGVRYSGNGGSRFDTIQRKRNGEFGSHWQGLLGGFNLETLVLQRLGHEDDSNTSAATGSSAAFLSTSDTGESIARATARYSPSDTLSFESGGEGAYNFLKGRSSYVSNGVPVSLPNANVTVDEMRGEVFASATWKPWPSLSIEGGARMEFSTISETGDTTNSRSFFYPKPRLLVSWAPDDKSQIRLRIERAVGQLNFSDFVASSNLSGFGVAGGNANLRPWQSWQLEGAAERHFFDRGALVFTYTHEEIEDLWDYIPIGGGLDALGNVPHASSDKFAISGTIPLDFIGITNGLLKPSVYWQNSSTIDPVTGESRRISGQRNISSYYNFSQDIDSLKSTWGFNWGTSFGNTNWRIAQISRATIHNSPFVNIYWSYKPTADWNFTLGADNFLPYRYQQEQDNYPGPRNQGGLPTVQNAFYRTEPRVYVQVRAAL